ncbi:MAG: right-handed parallel beta-helix repeat-containing protein, partial [Planctomycetota bacterium]
MANRPNHAAFFLTSVLLLSTLSIVAAAKTVYVDDDATGANNGTSWSDAYTFLQYALANATSSEKPVEIHVAHGIYKPNQGSENRTTGFQLINGVTLSGGYAGVTGSDPNTRDVAEYETVLSGDINGDDIDVGNPSDLHDEPTRSDNCSSVVVGSYTDQTAVLDGFTITGGRAKVRGWAIDHPTGFGGGMKNESGSPTVRNCIFVGNSAGVSGGGVGNINSNPTFINCTFADNCADYGAGISSSPGLPIQDIGIQLVGCVLKGNSASISGGGLIIRSGEATLTDCVFVGNSASQGGGMYCSSGNPKLTGCHFIGNNAQGTGGGLANRDEASATLIDCVFVDNLSDGWGGGLAGHNSIDNCIMSGNVSVRDGGALYGWGEVVNCTIIGNKAGGNGGGICTQGVATLANSIVRDNEALRGNEIYVRLHILPAGRSGTAEKIPSTMAIGYSNIGGGQHEVLVDTDCTLAWKAGNVDIEPLFAAPGYWADVNDPKIVVEPNDPNAIWIDGDYHLKSATGRWDPGSGTWIRDDVTSPCIDAGNPDSDLGQEVWPHGGRINIGAYGGTPQASMSTEPQAMLLPRVAYVYHNKIHVAEGYQALLTAYGCPTTLIPGQELATTPLDDYDLIIAGTDTGYSLVWADEQNVTAVEGSGKPVVGLGKGGYWYFGYL